MLPVITHMFKCGCIDPVFFHRRGRKARREDLFDYLCDLCALSGEMWVIIRMLPVITHKSVAPFQARQFHQRHGEHRVLESQ